VSQTRRRISGSATAYVWMGWIITLDMFLCGWGIFSFLGFLPLVFGPRFD